MRQRIQALLLCSIVIVLLALLTGIILKSRERYQNMVCSQRLKNLAEAAHRYHDDHKCLPLGYVGPWPDRPGVARAPNVGVLVYLLPYLAKDSKQWETPYYQTNLEALTDPEHKAKQYPIAADAPWWTLVNPDNSIYNLQLAQQHFDFLACPSMKQLEPREGLIVGLHSYGKEVYQENFLNCHILTKGDAPDATTSGITHYLGVAGQFGRGDQFEGVFGNRTKLRLEQITVKDGTGERHGSW